MSILSSRAHGCPSSYVDQPSKPDTCFEGGADVGRSILTAVIFTSLCFGALGSSVAYSADEASNTLSDYRKAAEARKRSPTHKTSPRDIGPNYDDAGNKPRQFDIGVALYDANDFSGAYAIWLPLAQRDDLAAQRNVAHLLRHGKGTSQDLPRALYFYERASEGGLVPAAVNAGVMHLRGEGTRADPETALRFLTVGVKSKHPVALYEVSLMLAQGLGITQNPKKARDYLTLSAAAGYAPAMQKLDAIKAAELIAAQPTPFRLDPAGNSASLPPKGAASKGTVSKGTVSTNKPHPQKANKKRQTLSLPTPALPAPTSSDPLTAPVPQARGHKPAIRAELASGIQLVRPDQGRRFVQGNQYYEAKRYLEAAKIWRQLAHEGVVEAQYRLGELYFQGQGLSQDTGQAIQWLTRAAERGHRGAATLLTQTTPAQR